MRLHQHAERVTCDQCSRPTLVVFGGALPEGWVDVRGDAHQFCCRECVLDYFSGLSIEERIPGGVRILSMVTGFAS